MEQGRQVLVDRRPHQFRADKLEALPSYKLYAPLLFAPFLLGSGRWARADLLWWPCHCQKLIRALWLNMYRQSRRDTHKHAPHQPSVQGLVDSRVNSKHTSATHSPIQAVVLVINSKPASSIVTDKMAVNSKQQHYYRCCPGRQVMM